MTTMMIVVKIIITGDTMDNILKFKTKDKSVNQILSEKCLNDIKNNAYFIADVFKDEKKQKKAVFQVLIAQVFFKEFIDPDLHDLFVFMCNEHADKYYDYFNNIINKIDSEIDEENSNKVVSILEAKNEQK